MTNILTQPKFSIAMVNYKTLELTKIALELLKKHFDSGELDSDRIDVWVVDNHISRCECRIFERPSLD